MGNIKHIVTEEDLLNNPELAGQGISVGDEIEIPINPGIVKRNGIDPPPDKPPMGS